LISEPDITNGLSPSRQSRHTGRRAHSWSRRSKLLLAIVIVVVLIDFFTALLLGTQVYTLNNQNRALRAELAKSQDELHQAIPELRKVRQELDELIRGKLPRLHKLEYDQVFSLNQGYLKNMTFTKVAKNKIQSYEYKLVVQNNTSSLLWPEIQILLFNELGIQVGNAEIGTANPIALKAPSLSIGEVRSYSGILQLPEKNEMPTYFLIRIPGDDNQLDAKDPVLRTGGVGSDSAVYKTQ
jgi:cell division protein FtsL